MCTSDSISVGMLTSSSASAISSSEVVNGCPACGLRTVRCYHAGSRNWNMFQKSRTAALGRNLRVEGCGYRDRVNGTAPPDVPLADIDLGSWDFWVLDDDLRDGAFATLRREAPISFHRVLWTRRRLSPDRAIGR